MDTNNKPFAPHLLFLRSPWLGTIYNIKSKKKKKKNRVALNGVKSGTEQEHNSGDVQIEKKLGGTK